MLLRSTLTIEIIDVANIKKPLQHYIASNHLIYI
jgi:hypothetical protein